MASTPALRPNRTNAARRLLWRADSRFSPYVYVAPFFLLFIGFGLFPLLYTGYVSLTNRDLLRPGVETYTGLANYRRLGEALDAELKRADRSDARSRPRFQPTVGTAILSVPNSTTPSVNWAAGIQERSPGKMPSISCNASNVEAGIGEVPPRCAWVSTRRRQAALCKAGADIIVVGNAFEKDPALILSIGNAIHSSIII
jgi:hypothetical protein